MKLLIAILFVLSYNYSFAQFGEMKGVVYKDSTASRIPFAKVKVYQNNVLIQESVADSSGRYKIVNLSPGKYDVYCEEIFHWKGIVAGVIITADHISFANFFLKKIEAK